MSRLFRDAVLQLSKAYPFARKLVNSGRLSMPSVHGDTALNTPDGDVFGAAMRPGAPAADAPLRVQGEADWLLWQTGNEFTGLYFAGAENDAEKLRELEMLTGDRIPVQTLVVAPAGQASPGMLEDIDGLLAERYDARPGTLYLLRPDQHVCARWRYVDTAAVRAAVARATGNAAAPQAIPPQTEPQVEHA